MSKNKLKKAFYKQLNQGKLELKQKNYKKSFYHLENAHILGQKNIYRHTISHFYMLVYAIKIKSIKEFLGQILRIIASLIFTLIWVPVGNTGGSNISPTKSISIRTELKKYFKN